MLSIKTFKNANSAAQYYSHGDYYGSDGEGMWLGEAAKELGLEGKLTAKNNKQFNELLSGILPNGQMLGRHGKNNQGLEHRAGTDLTFSVPKSFSLQMMLYADPEEKQQLEQAVMNAVVNTLKFIEKEGLVFCRKAQGGKITENLHKLTFAAFMHTTNRNLEPQVHVHSFLANIAICSDGKYRSITNDRLLENTKLLGQLFRNELAFETKNLGLEISPTVLSDGSSSFELTKIHPKLIDAFSTRRQEIVELFKLYGVTSKEGRDRIVVNSRKAKKQIAYEKLVMAWNSLENQVRKEIDDAKSIELAKPSHSHSHKFSIFEKLFNRHESVLDQMQTHSEPLNIRDIAMLAVTDLSYSKSVFSKNELMKTALKYSLGSFEISNIVAELKNLEKEGILLKNNDLFTTRDLVKKEQKIIAYASTAINNAKPIIKSEKFSSHYEKYQIREIAKNTSVSINDTQRKAIKHILTSTSSIITMEGLPGVGKSTVLNSVRDISSRKVINLIGNPFGFGEKFHGSAPTASAAKTLQLSAKVESQTLHSFLAKYQGYIQNRGSKGSLKHFKQEYKNSIIFVDEASLISTNIMHQLLTLQEKFGFRLVLTGDTKQLSSIEAGKPFEQIIKLIKPVILKEIIRQKDDAHKEAVLAASEGKIGKTFMIHDKNIYSSNSIVHDAVTNYLSKTPKQRENTLLISPTRATRDEINQKVVEKLNLDTSVYNFTALRAKDMSKADYNFSHFYNEGDILKFNTSYKNGINKGDYLKVKAVNKVSNSLILEKNNKSIQFNVNAKTDYSRKIEIFQERAILLQEGLKIIFTKNNKELGLINSDTALIQKIDKNIITLKGEDGSIKSIQLSELKHVDYGYCITVHAAQGKTFDSTIAAITTNNLLNSQKMWLVALSRHKSEISVLVEDKMKLQNQITKNHGNTLSAMDITSSKTHV